MKIVGLLDVHTMLFINTIKLRIITKMSSHKSTFKGLKTIFNKMLRCIYNFLEQTIMV